MSLSLSSVTVLELGAPVFTLGWQPPSHRDLSPPHTILGYRLGRPHPAIT